MNGEQPEQIYRDFYPKVRSYVGGKVNNPEDAEDLCADVFTKVYEKLPSFDASKASLSTWIYTITRNRVIDYFRSRRPFAELGDDSAVTEGPENALINSETLHLLAAALKELPEEQRDIVLLRYAKRHTLQSISTLMGLSYGAVKLRHADALRTLRSRLVH